MKIKISAFIFGKILDSNFNLDKFLTDDENRTLITSTKKDIQMCGLVLYHNNSDFNMEVSYEYLKWFAGQMDVLNSEGLCSYEQYISNK